MPPVLVDGFCHDGPEMLARADGFRIHASSDIPDLQTLHRTQHFIITHKHTPLMLVYLNGNYIPREQASLPLDDRGFLFGDGIYEVIRVVNGQPFRMDDHLRRLDYGIAGLGLSVSEEQHQELVPAMNRLLQENNLLEGEATIYLQITRGAAPSRSHSWPHPPVPPTMYITAARFSPAYELQKTGAHAITLPDQRWSRCDLKTVNLLPNTMAAELARQRGAFGTLFIRDGAVIEGFNNNVFFVMDGVLHTHPDSPYMLGGITRIVVFEIAEQLGIPVRLTPVQQADIFKASEVILTGTTTDIMPIIKVDDRSIGAGAPGEVAQLLQKAYYQLIGAA